MAIRAHYWRFPTVTTLAILFLMFWLSMPESCDGRPSWALPAKTFAKDGLANRTPTQCEDDVELLELCQRCAKATKSNYAYPMCCSDQENAINWCKDYLYFGIQ